MSEYEKPPPYTQEAPPTMNQPRGYNGAAPILTSAQMQSPGNTYGGVPAGYTTVPAASMPSYGSTVYVQQVPVLPQVVLVGGCPACRVGVLEDDFTCLGVCLAILFFPLGILCCLAMKQRRCPNCGAIFG